MKLRKVLSAILCIAMVLGTMSFTVFAENDPVCVAEINGTQYATLFEAVEAAQDGDTIRMIESFEIKDDLEKDPWTIYEMPENSILDLNGKTLTIQFGRALFAGSNFTIKNGNLTVPVPTDYALFIGSYYPGTSDVEIETNATIEDVTVVDAGINISYGAKATLKNNTVTVNPNRKYYAVYANGGAEVIIESGTYAGGRKNIDILKADSADVTVIGGTYKNNPADYVPFGYSVSEENNTYIVSEDPLARSLSVVVEEETASVDDVVEANVVVNGSGMTFADWTFEYDPSVFSCTEDADGDGKIEGNSFSGSTPYNDGESIKTYKLVVIAQENDETPTTLTFSDDSVVGNDDDSIAVGLQRETELVSDTVTIMFKDFDTIKTMVDGVEETTSSKTILYDAKNHTFEVVSEAGANVEYIVEKDGQVVDISVNKLKDMGTYVIKYTITKYGYNDKSGEFEIIITQPDNEIELVPNFVKGKVAVLVYTNIDDISYQYDNNLMVDVTAKYSKAGYKKVFGYVTEPLKDGNDNVTLDKAVYAEKLLAEVPENASLAKITKIDYDLAEDNVINYLDVNAGYGVYNARTAYFNVNAMKIVFKADVNGDKAVSFEDAEAVYNEVYKSAE